MCFNFFHHLYLKPHIQPRIQHLRRIVRYSFRQGEHICASFLSANPSTHCCQPAVNVADSTRNARSTYSRTPTNTLFRCQLAVCTSAAGMPQFPLQTRMPSSSSVQVDVSCARYARWNNNGYLVFSQRHPWTSTWTPESLYLQACQSLPPQRGAWCPLLNPTVPYHYSYYS